jgi:hypothetical protein
MTQKDFNNVTSDKMNPNNQNQDSDELDLKLVDLILKGHDFSTMSKETNAPLSTIHRRSKKILNTYFINDKKEPDYNKCGMKKGFLFVNIHGQRNSQSIAEDISRISQVISVSLTIGNYDLVCSVFYRDSEELLDILGSIKKIKDIIKVLFAEEIIQHPINNNNLLYCLSHAIKNDALKNTQ